RRRALPRWCAGDRRGAGRPPDRGVVGTRTDRGVLGTRTDRGESAHPRRCARRRRGADRGRLGDQRLWAAARGAARRHRRDLGLGHGRRDDGTRARGGGKGPGPSTGSVDFGWGSLGSVWGLPRADSRSGGARPRRRSGLRGLVGAGEVCLPESMRAEQLTDPIAFHGEGPVWSPSWGGLRWVDMLAGDILTLRGDRVERRHVGDVAAAVRPRSRGGAVIGVERGCALESETWQITVLPELWTETGIRMNEGGCDPQGNFWCGSMASGQRVGAACLYRLSPDGKVDVMLEGVTVSNGIDWSPDGSLVYYNDTATRQIAVFDF